MTDASRREFIPVNIAVLTASDTRVEADDTSGRTLAERLTAAGHHLADKQIVPDDVYRIRAVVADWIARADIQAVITTGGTGVSGRDGSPEAVTPLLDKVLDGFGEMFRALSFEDIGDFDFAIPRFRRRCQRHLFICAARLHRRLQTGLG